MPPITLPDPPANAWRLMGAPIWPTLPAEATGGALTVLDYLPGPNDGPPLHLHTREDETIHLLAGRLKARRGEAMLEIGPGETLFLPRGVPHTWRCVGPDPARLLVVITPSGFEGFFRDWHEAPLRMPEDNDAIAARIAGYGVSVLGPPLE